MKRIVAITVGLLLLSTAISEARPVTDAQIDTLFASVKASDPGAAVMVIQHASQDRRAHEFSPGLAHETVHRHVHHAAGARRQVAL